MLHSGITGRIILTVLCQLFKPFILVIILLYRIHSLKKKEKIIVLANTLGDSVYGLSCLDEIKTKYSDYRIKVVCCLKWKGVVESYIGIDEIIYWKKNIFIALLIETLETSEFLSALALKCNIYGCVFGFRRGLKSKDIREIHALRLYYGLPKEGKITYHGEPICTNINSISEFHERKDRIVLINPYSTTCAEIDYLLYTCIINELKKRGYDIYTNAPGSYKELPKTKKLNCSIYELFNMAKEIPLIVSQRSGILDYIITSGINMFVICPTQSYGLDRRLLTKRFSLLEWETGGMIAEHVLRINSDEDHANIMNHFIYFLDSIEKMHSNKESVYNEI